MGRPKHRTKLIKAKVANKKVKNRVGRVVPIDYTDNHLGSAYTHKMMVLRARWAYTSTTQALRSAIDIAAMVIAEAAAQNEDYFSATQWPFLASAVRDHSLAWQATFDADTLAGWVADYAAKNPAASGVADGPAVIQKCRALSPIRVHALLRMLQWYWRARAGDVPYGSHWWTKKYQDMLFELKKRRSRAGTAAWNKRHKDNKDAPVNPPASA